MSDVKNEIKESIKVLDELERELVGFAQATDSIRYYLRMANYQAHIFFAGLNEISEACEASGEYISSRAVHEIILQNYHQELKEG